MSVASLVGFGAVVAAMPAFAVVRDAVLGIGGGPLVSLAVATNVLAALTGSASGGLTIALDALGATYMTRAAEIGLDPALLHRVAVIGSGTLDSLPHNGAVVTLLAVCGSTHRESYRDIVMVGIVGALWRWPPSSRSARWWVRSELSAWAGYIASFRGELNFGRYRGIADPEAGHVNQSRFMSMRLGPGGQDSQRPSLQRPRLYRDRGFRAAA